MVHGDGHWNKQVVSLLLFSVINIRHTIIIIILSDRTWAIGTLYRLSVTLSVCL